MKFYIKNHLLDKNVYLVYSQKEGNMLYYANHKQYGKGQMECLGLKF